MLFTKKYVWSPGVGIAGFCERKKKNAASFGVSPALLRSALNSVPLSPTPSHPVLSFLHFSFDSFLSRRSFFPLASAASSCVSAQLQRVTLDPACWETGRTQRRAPSEERWVGCCAEGGAGGSTAGSPPPPVTTATVSTTSAVTCRRRAVRATRSSRSTISFMPPAKA